MNLNLSELKAREEAKREKCWNAQDRWRAIQATIAWAESQATVRRNTAAACLKEQAEIQSGKRVKKPDNLSSR